MRLAIFLVLIGVVYTYTVSYKGYKLYEVTPKTKLEVEALHKLEIEGEFDFWVEPNRIGTPCTVMVSPEKQDRFENFLKNGGFIWKIKLENVQELIEEDKARNHFAKLLRKPKNGRISFDQYYNYDEIIDYFNELAHRFPNLVTVEDYGSSFEGRVLKSLKISKNPEAENPIFLIDGGIHSREWISPAMVLYIINQIIEEPENSGLLDYMDWIIIPVLNPDGYQYTYSADRLWRKTRSENNSTCLGVDANRNFDHHYNEGGASSIPCSDTYNGPNAASEIEVEDFVNYAKKYAERIKFYVTFHSSAQCIIYPWGYTYDLPEDNEILKNVGQLAADAIEAVRGTSYPVDAITQIMYVASGNTVDYFKGELGVQLSYTLELPGFQWGFILPPSEILGVVTETFEGIKVWHDYLVENVI